VSTFRQRKLGKEFDDAMAAAQSKIEESEKRGRYF
jgi:hypothetical protein